MQPLNDRVLIRRIEEPEQRIGSIIVPGIAKSKAIKGEVIAVGRGKWHPGGWWYVHGYLDINKGPETDYFWKWIEGYREVPSVYPGQIVYFNSKWSDMGTDYQHPGVGWDETLHLVMEGDIFGIIN